MGSHTDYNLGYVLTLPIAWDTWMAIRPRGDQSVRLFSLNLEAGNGFDLADIQRLPGKAWSNYVRGVASILAKGGFDLRGFDAVIHSTVPISSGLSSSAALECATATAFEALSGSTIDPVRKALLCQRAENEFVGVNCGILDQFTSCMGRSRCALLLDCRDLSSRPVPMAEGITVVICDTLYKRELAGSEYDQRRAQCEEGARRLGFKALREISLDEFYAREQELPKETARRCRFIVEESQRVLDLAKALTGNDRVTIRKLTAESFRGACDLYEISVPAMHAMFHAMTAAPGLVGARQAGAGFGGCMVALVASDQVDAFAAFVRHAYHKATGTQPMVNAVQAAGGAGVIPADSLTGAPKYDAATPS
jgi:galactokinase